MKEFYVSFGTVYAYEPHPCEWVHPDGYLTVVAEDYSEAREAVWNLTGGKFAFMYEELPDQEYFPLGEIKRIYV